MHNLYSEKLGNQMGVSVGELLNGGFDWLVTIDKDGNSYSGYVGSFGMTVKAPFPVEYHEGLTNTRLIASFNMYEVMAEIYHAIEAW